MSKSTGFVNAFATIVSKLVGAALMSRPIDFRLFEIMMPASARTGS